MNNITSLTKSKLTPQLLEQEHPDVSRVVKLARLGNAQYYTGPEPGEELAPLPATVPPEVKEPVLTITIPDSPEPTYSNLPDSPESPELVSTAALPDSPESPEPDRVSLNRAGQDQEEGQKTEDVRENETDKPSHQEEEEEPEGIKDFAASIFKGVSRESPVDRSEEYGTFSWKKHGGSRRTTFLLRMSSIKKWRRSRSQLTMT